MESAFDVANIFCIEFYTNWSFWIAESSPIFGSIFQRIDRDRAIWGAMAMVTVFFFLFYCSQQPNCEFHIVLINRNQIQGRAF